MLRYADDKKEGERQVRRQSPAWMNNEGVLWRAGCLVASMACAPLLAQLPSYVRELYEVLLFFLVGWMGFCAGTYLELRVIRRVRYDTLALALFQAGAVLILVALASWPAMGWVESIGGGGKHPLWVCIALGAIAAVTLPSGSSVMSSRAERRKEGEQTLTVLSFFGNGLTIAWVAFLAAAPDGTVGFASSRAVLLGLGIGGVAGLILDRATRERGGGLEGIAFSTGILAVAFSLGARWDLGVFPIGAVAGVWLINATSRRLNVLEDVRRLRALLEGGLLVLLGATVPVNQVISSEGMIALGLGVGLSLCRFVGKLLGVRAGGRVFPRTEMGERGAVERAFMPQGGLAAAVAYALGLRGLLLVVVLCSILVNLGVSLLLEGSHGKAGKHGDRVAAWKAGGTTP